MKNRRILIALFIYGLQLSGCGDSNFLDKTALVSSILKGSLAETGSALSSHVVLIAKKFEIRNGKPVFFGICSGVILNSRTILTAAHCISEHPEHMRVVLNPKSREEFNEVEHVYEVIDHAVHHDYQKKIDLEIKSLHELQDSADLALLYVHRQFTGIADSFQQPLLQTSESAQIFKSTIDLVIAGFGKSSNLENTAHIPYEDIIGNLRQATIRIPISNLKKSTFSVLQKQSAGVCTGDSGGPVFMKRNDQFQLVAIAVDVYRLPNTQMAEGGINKRTLCSGYGLYLNLEFYKPWIIAAAKALEKLNN